MQTGGCGGRGGREAASTNGGVGHAPGYGGAWVRITVPDGSITPTLLVYREVTLGEMCHRITTPALVMARLELLATGAKKLPEMTTLPPSELIDGGDTVSIHMLRCLQDRDTASGGGDRGVSGPAVTMWRRLTL